MSCAEGVSWNGSRDDVEIQLEDCDEVGFLGNHVCVLMTKRGVESRNGDMKGHGGNAGGTFV